ncbi:MAG TPA: hypothetical protein VHE30_19995 [Polyangiaceae bacterium]|nr:hypothetical protein [Polyangiaceae bacterium]
MTDTAPSAIERERLRRLVSVHRAAMPRDEEIHEARMRSLRRRVVTRGPGNKLLVAALVQGFVLGVVVLASAAFVAHRFETRHERRAILPAPVPVAATLPRAFHPAPRPSAAEPAPAPPPREPVTFEAAPVPPRREPVTSEATPGVVPSAAFVGREAPLEVRRGGEGSAAGDSDADGPWQRVSRALSHGEIAEADRHLVALARSSDGATRDAAELARAELWIAHGRAAEFRAVVQRLAEHGATALVRKRAAALLSRTF